MNKYAYGKIYAKEYKYEFMYEWDSMQWNYDKYEFMKSVHAL